MLEEVESSGRDVAVAKWEYTVLADRGRMHRVTADELNKYGEQGWELFSIGLAPGTSTGEVHFYFKRPKL